MAHLLGKTVQYQQQRIRDEQVRHPVLVFLVPLSSNRSSHAERDGRMACRDSGQRTIAACRPRRRSSEFVDRILGR